MTHVTPLTFFKYPTIPWSKQGATTTTDIERNPYQWQERVQATSFPNSFNSKNISKIVYNYFDPFGNRTVYSPAETVAKLLKILKFPAKH